MQGGENPCLDGKAELLLSTRCWHVLAKLFHVSHNRTLYLPTYPPQFPSLHCLRTCNVFPFYFYVKCCPSKADLQRPWGGTNLSPFIKWFDIPLKPTILYAGIYRHPGEGLMHVINMAKHLWDTIAAGTPHFHHSNSNTHILRDQ